jgi:hypothetical protein
VAGIGRLRHRGRGAPGRTSSDRCFTLSRRGWKNVGIVVGDDLESAERRFFDAWVDKPWSDQSSAQAPGSGLRASFATGLAPARRSPDSSEVLGLFPQPGASR